MSTHVHSKLSSVFMGHALACNLTSYIVREFCCMYLHVLIVYPEFGIHYYHGKQLEITLICLLTT